MGIPVRINDLRHTQFKSNAALDGSSHCGKMVASFHFCALLWLLVRPYFSYSYRPEFLLISSCLAYKILSNFKDGNFATTLFLDVYYLRYMLIMLLLSDQLKLAYKI